MSADLARLPLLLVALVTSFALPGFFIARALRARDLPGGAFMLSLLVLFYSVMLVDAARIPVTLGPVLGLQLVVTAFAYAAGRRRRPAAASEDAPDDSGGRWTWLLLPAVVLGLLMLARTTLQPLAFLDAYWRWDFLAHYLLYTRSFDHYPPFTAADFNWYLYPDGVPPMVGIAYWVPYAALARHAPSTTSIFITLQYVATGWMTYRLGARLFGRFAGVAAVAVLASSSAFFVDVAIGQDTGLTAFAVVAMAWFLLTADRDDPRAAVLAGCAAALGAVTREYGLAFVFGGLVVAAARRMSPRSLGAFLAVAVALSAPWYLRNWALTGNPVYDNPVGGLFPCNVLHTTALKFYGQVQAAAGERAAWPVARKLLEDATLPLLLGLAGAALALRTCAPLVGLCLLSGLLFVLSAPYTQAGPVWASRVLSPAWPLMSVCAGALALRLRGGSRLAFSLGLVVFTVWRTGPTALTWASDPHDIPMAYWLSAATHTRPATPGPVLALGPAIEALGPDALILTENAIFSATLAPHGVHFLSVWSPQVLFLFDPSLSGAECTERLRDLGVTAVATTRPGHNMDRLLFDNFPFFRDELEHWKVTAESHNGAVYLLPPRR